MGDPLRSCIGCRKRRAQRQLLRFVADERGRLGLDMQGRGTGRRSAYVCANRGCLGRASKPGAFARTLRHGVAFESDELVGRILEDLRGMGDRLLARCARDGRAHGAATRISDDESSCCRGRFVWRGDTWLITEPRAARRMAEIEQFVTSLLEQ